MLDHRSLSYNNILSTIKYTLSLMRNMFTQHTTRYARLVPTVKHATNYRG